MSKRTEEVAQHEIHYMEQLHEFTRVINKINQSAVGGASIREIKNGLKKTVPMLEKLIES